MSPHPSATAADLALAVHDELEALCWAPWLRFSAAELREHREVFPEGQVALFDDTGRPVASLDTVRIDWDGDPLSLPTWDEVAGGDRGYRAVHRPDGNAVSLLSMSIRHDARGRRIPRLVIDELRARLAGSGVQHIVGDFRPSGFGRYKRLAGERSFAEYVELLDDDGLPADGWLRTVRTMGAVLLRVDPTAMVVRATVEELHQHRQEHHPERWWQVTDEHRLERQLGWHRPLRFIARVDEVWECGETGTWYLDRRAGDAVYVESNVWGRLDP